MVVLVWTRAGQDNEADTEVFLLYITTLSFSGEIVLCSSPYPRQPTEGCCVTCVCAVLIGVCRAAVRTPLA